MMFSLTTIYGAWYFTFDICLKRVAWVILPYMVDLQNELPLGVGQHPQCFSDRVRDDDVDGYVDLRAIQEDMIATSKVCVKLYTVGRSNFIASAVIGEVVGFVIPMGIQLQSSFYDSLFFQAQPCSDAARPGAGAWSGARADRRDDGLLKIKGLSQMIMPPDVLEALP